MAVQGFYSRVNTHVVVKAVRLSSTSMLEPGTILKPGDLRVFHMRSLFKRRSIGIKDTPWVDAQLEALKIKKKKRKAKKAEAVTEPAAKVEKKGDDIQPTVVKKEAKPKVKKTQKMEKPWENGND